jgi:HlyD family secretion protein
MRLQKSVPMLVLFVFAAIAVPSFAGDAPPPPETAKAVREPIRVEVTLPGFLEAKKRTEVLLDPQAWTGFVVVRAVEQGARVRRGDSLVEFETDKMDEEIADLEAAQAASALALSGAEDEARWAEELKPLDLTAALRARSYAEEDLKLFLDVESPLSEKSAKNSVLQAKWNLEYVSEELRQLEKMYKADEITEETEEIVLLRARRDVESARFGLEVTEVRSDGILKVSLPRQKEAAIEAAKRAATAFERTMSGIRRAEEKRKLDLAKMKADNEKSAKKLGDLRKDRAVATIAAPQDGVVYIGRLNRGRWADPGPLAEELRPGATVTGRKVLMTVVDPRSLVVRADLPEKELSRVRSGIEGRAAPPSLGGAKLGAKVEKVSAAPIAPGVFDATIAVELPEAAAALLPGMECPVALAAGSSPTALAIPAGAVFEDESGTHVFLVKGGKPERRAVKVGLRTDAKVEIVEGLAEGDEVLLKKPEKAPAPSVEAKASASA